MVALMHGPAAVFNQNLMMAIERTDRSGDLFAGTSEKLAGAVLVDHVETSRASLPPLHASGSDPERAPAGNAVRHFVSALAWVVAMAVVRYLRASFFCKGYANRYGMRQYQSQLSSWNGKYDPMFRL